MQYVSVKFCREAFSATWVFQLAAVFVCALGVPRGYAAPEDGFYVGVGGGYSTLAPDERDERWQTVVDEGEAYRLFAGYEFVDRLFLEFDYLDLGEAWVDSDLGGRGVDYSAASVAAGIFAFPFDRQWNPFLRAGVGRLGVQIAGDSDEFSTGDTTSPLLSAGVQWAPSDRLWGRLEWTRYRGEPEVYLFSIGYRIDVGSRFRFRYLDHDNDGVIDKRDLCPNTRLDTAVDEKGCTLDMDRDGVADSFDQCLDTRMGAEVDERGCAPVAAFAKSKQGGCGYGCAEEAEPLVEVTLNILFDTASALIKPEYRADIARLGQVLSDYPGSRVVIEGHTDSRGDAEANQRLSIRRAESVAQVLIEEYAIEAHRVSAVGYGEMRPLQNAKNEQALVRNRRVVAKVYSGDQ